METERLETTAKRWSRWPGKIKVIISMHQPHAPILQVNFNTAPCAGVLSLVTRGLEEMHYNASSNPTRGKKNTLDLLCHQEARSLLSTNPCFCISRWLIPQSEQYCVSQAIPPSRAPVCWSPQTTTAILAFTCWLLQFLRLPYSTCPTGLLLNTSN